ncbi:MAG: hypothetical protein WAO00_14720 [Chthoniobacterales bacterium]
MILFIGSSADRVSPRLLKALQESSRSFAFVDEDHPFDWEVRCEQHKSSRLFQIRGGECTGRRPVGSIFVRHAVARTLDTSHLNKMGELQSNLNRMLLFSACPVVNSPANSYSNYSKPYQLGLMASAGFDIPRTLVTNRAAEARRFYLACGRQVIFKGVSNVMTFAQLLKPEHFARLNLLPNSPTLFQEYIAGADYRVHVVGDRTFCTRLQAANEDYRRSALIEDEEINAIADHLPQSVLRRCIAFTRQLGLIVSGIDFKKSKAGRLAALELNPYPQFTFYEGRSGQRITESVVDYLIQNHVADTNVFA